MRTALYIAQYVVQFAAFGVACYMTYRWGRDDGIRKGQALADGVCARTYNRAREEGWQAGYAEGLEDAGK